MLDRYLRNNVSGIDIARNASTGQPVINYPPSSYFSIDHMWLSIEPDFKAKRINCKQQLKIAVLQDLKKIELDCAFNDTHKIEINSVFYSDGASVSDNKQLSFQQYNDRLSIDIKEILHEGSKFYLLITYSTLGTKPPDGFVFVESENQLSFQAWTQGEPIASRKWFPCIDHPQVKFPRELSIIVPKNYIVISNGERDILDQEVKGEKKKKYVWEESHPNTAYVTSVVIGDFAELPQENHDNRVPLLYYVPHGREKDGHRLFINTSKIMEFFESFLEIKYPYDKYSQVTVEEFAYGGMENTTCTTLETAQLPDEKTIHDSDTYDHVVVHELAHQWFGDLVTCRDWQHIWLNEAFTSYCEALYYQHTLGDNDFYYYMLGKSDEYLYHNNVDKVHKIPLVSKRYNKPLDTFVPSARTYQKGACIVHMLRCLLGDNDFKKSLKSYFDLFKHKVAETEDLRKIFEQNSGIALERFFDQWIYQAGHPDLKATFSSNNNSINIKIEQVQSPYEFEFSLEIRIVLQVDIDKEKTIDDTLLIAGKEIQKTYNINPGAVVKRFVIDPNFKILKKLSLVIEGANNSILINSLLNGETIVERIYAARALKDKQSDDLVDPLKKTILLREVYWGVSVEAAKTLGTIKSDASYQALKECVNAIGNSRIKESVIKALGSFSKADSFDLLKRILENDHESAIVQRAAATAIAESENEERTLPILIRLMEQKSHKDNVARGAIEGLKRIAMNSDKKKKIESLLIQKTNMGNEARVRQAATSALGYVARYHKERTNIVSHLKGLLNDRSIHVRNTAFASLANIFEYSKDQQIIQELKQKLKEEDNDFVIETAEKSISLINETRPTSLFLDSEKSLLRDREYKIREIEDMEKCIVLY